jgi:hypothetical protein
MTQLSLETVTIDGFRGLRNLTLEGLGPVNILVGENNSGKTSVLEALSILCNAYDPYEWLAMVRRRDFGSLDETRIHSLRWAFPQAGELVDPDFMFEAQCEMTSLGGFPVRKLHVDFKDILGEPNPRELERLRRQRPGTGNSLDEEWRGAEIVHYIEADAASDRQATLFGDATRTTVEPVSIQVWEEDRLVGRPRMVRRRGNLPTETLTPYSYQINRIQVRSHSKQLFPSETDPLSGKHMVLELVRQFDPDVVDIEIASFRGGRPAIYLNHKRLGPAPLTVFGDAMRRAMLLSSTLLELKGGGVLLIDEVEAGIHVSALKRVFSWLTEAASSLGVQIIATTHSLEAVDAISGSILGPATNLVTYRLDQTENGTESKRIHGDLLHRLRFERGLDVR